MYGMNGDDVKNYRSFSIYAIFQYLNSCGDDNNAKEKKNYTYTTIKYLIELIVNVNAIACARWVCSLVHSFACHRH